MDPGVVSEIFPNQVHGPTLVVEIQFKGQNFGEMVYQLCGPVEAGSRQVALDQACQVGKDG
jgi:hypothetical protein